MIMICTRKCFILDRSIKPGTAIDIPTHLLDSDVVRSSFEKPAEDKAETAKELATKVTENAELTATELKRRLDQMGVAYRGNSSREALDKLYSEQAALRSSVEG